MTKDYGARLSFRTTTRIDEALAQQAKLTCRSKNSLINEAVQMYVAREILNCSIKELQSDETPIDQLFQDANRPSA